MAGVEDHPTGDQPVITTTTADGGLGSKLITDLKGRVAVVIQATHQP